MYDLDKMDNEELGAKVRWNIEKRREYVAQQTPFWQKEGALMQATRTGIGISQREVSEMIGVSTQTLRKLERGQSVRSRKMMKQSYETAIDFINLKRTLSLQQLKETPEREQIKRAWATPSSFDLFGRL